jgi:hypothetical protein
MDFDEGIEMFAASLCRSRGSAAELYARQRAADLRNYGDSEGQVVWEKVADAISSMQQTRKH